MGHILTAGGHFLLGGLEGHAVAWNHQLRLVHLGVYNMGTSYKRWNRMLRADFMSFRQLLVVNLQLGFRHFDMPVISVMLVEPGVCHPHVHWGDGAHIKLAKCFFKVISIEMLHDMLSCVDDSVSINQLGEGDHEVGN